MGLCPQKIYVEYHHQVHWIPSGHREEEERAVREDRGVPLQAEDVAGSHLHSQRSHCCWSQGWGEWLSFYIHGPFEEKKSRRRNGITGKHIDHWISRLVLSSVAPRSVFQARSSFTWESAHHFRLSGKMHITSGKVAQSKPLSSFSHPPPSCYWRIPFQKNEQDVPSARKGEEVEKFDLRVQRRTFNSWWSHCSLLYFRFV